MRKLSIAAMIAFGAVFVAGTHAARAQEIEKGRVPFPVVVGNVVMPAGSYEVRADDLDPELLHITSADGRHAAFALVMTDSTTTRFGDCEFRFVRLGSRYYLSKIDTGAGDIEQITLPEFVERAIHQTRADH